MNLVHRRKLVSRAIFSKLPFGAVCWDAASLNTKPFVKLGRKTVINQYNVAGNGSNDGSLSTTAKAANASMVRAPKFLLVQN